MKRHRFWCFWKNGRAELHFAVMRSDEMQQMHAHVFRRGQKIFPGSGVLRRQLSPKRIYELEADGDVADQFAALIVAHNEAALGILVFPKFAGVVKKNAGDE